MNREEPNPFALPYQLFAFGVGDERFALVFREFDAEQDAFSVQHSGIRGIFEAVYRGSGMDCRFECDMTIASLYYFYIALDNAYECLPGTDPVVTLQNAGESPEHTKVIFRFDRKGHCLVNGCIRNLQNGCQSGLMLNMKIDVMLITEMLVSMERFFDEVRRIQGHDSFY